MEIELVQLVERYSIFFGFLDGLIGMYASHFSALQNCVWKLNGDIPRLESWMEVIANFLPDQNLPGFNPIYGYATLLKPLFQHTLSNSSSNLFCNTI